MRTHGKPVGRSIARTRHLSLTQMYASSGDWHAAHDDGSSPSRGGSTSTGGSNFLVRRCPSNGKLGQLTNAGREPDVDGWGVDVSDTRETIAPPPTRCLDPF